MEEEYMENTDTDQAESEDTENYVDNETATVLFSTLDAPDHPYISQIK